MFLIKLIVWFILLVIKISIAVTVLTFLIGIYEALNDRDLRAKVGIPEVLLGLFSEVLASIFSIFISPFGYFRLENRFKHSATEVEYDHPVLLIHPYFGNPALMVFLLFKLKRSGFKNVYTVMLRPRLAGLRHFLTLIESKVQKIIEETGTEKVALVGHSMGGLLARMFALERPAMVSAVVSLGSPHMGSKLAVFGIGKCAREMEPESQLIKEIEGKFPDVPFLSVWSPVDNLAVPQRTALIPEDGEKINYEAPPVGHLALLYTPSVLDSVVSFLQSKVPSGE